MSTSAAVNHRKSQPSQHAKPVPRSGPVDRAKAPAEPVKASEADVVLSPDIVTDMLKRYNFEYELVELPVASVNRKQSELNQARISKPVDEDQVLLYAEAMKSGDRFPPIVVYKVNDAYIVMDGNHRVAAADIADIETLKAYVVRDPSPAQVIAFTYEANTKHGLPTSLQDRMRQAINLISRGTHKAPDAARQLGLPLNQLRSAIDQYNAERRFEALGVRKFAPLTATAKRRLDSIYSDVTLRAAAELALDATLTGDQLTALIKDINSLRSEKEQLALIARERESRSGLIKATAGGRMPVPQPLVTLSRMTSTINRMVVADILDAMSTMPAEIRRDHARAASESVTRLMEIVRAIHQSTSD